MLPMTFLENIAAFPIIDGGTILFEGRIAGARLISPGQGSRDNVDHVEVYLFFQQGPGAQLVQLDGSRAELIKNEMATTFGFLGEIEARMPDQAVAASASSYFLRAFAIKDGEVVGQCDHFVSLVHDGAPA